jgi:copper chaperone CopZ
MSAKIKLYAPNISCQHCAKTIKRELGPLEGIVSVEVDVPTKAIDLEYADDAALARARALLAEIDYPVT